jgi:purine-binding chemotaxis protein CheW
VRRLVAIEVEGVRMAVPLEAVERVVRMVAVTPLPSVPPIIRGLINDRGRLLPVVDPRVRFGFAAREPRLDDRLVIVRTPERTLALIASEVQGVIEAEDAEAVPVSSILPSGGSVEAVVRLPDGLLLIQDMGRFLSLEEDMAVRGATG